MRAYAVAGSFDDCHRLTREAFANPELRRSMRLTSANSVNVGRLLPQSIYYFHAVAPAADAPARLGPPRRLLDAERQFRQPHRRPDGEARRPADRALRRRDQRERRRARVSRDRPVRAAAVDADARPTRWTSATRATSIACCGCTAAISTRCAATSPAAGITDDDVRATIRARLRGARLPARSALRDRLPGLTVATGGGREPGGAAGCSWRPRTRRSSPRSSSRSSAGAIEKPAPLAEALATVRSTSSESARRSIACAAMLRWLTRCVRYRPDVLEHLLRARHPADGAHAAGAGARLRPRPLQVRNPPPARALPRAVNFRRRNTPGAWTICAASIRCSRCTRASSSNRQP